MGFRKRNFKEIELLMLKTEGHEFSDLDKMDKMLYDLCFAKTGLDVPTILAIRAILESSQITYKALEEAELIDPNEPYAVVEISRKKVKRLVKKSLKISKKSNSIEELGIDTLDNLSPDTINFNEAMLKDIVKEVVQGTVDKALKELQAHCTIQTTIPEEKAEERPVEEILDEILAEEEELLQEEAKESQEEELVTAQEPEKKPEKKKKSTKRQGNKKSNTKTEPESDNDEEITAEELAALKKK